MRRSTFAIAVLAAVAAVPASAFAMEPYLPKWPAAFSKADVDANGKLTAAELTPRAEKRFNQADANHDGQVTSAEVDQSLQKALARRHARIMADLDTNKDGVITKAELDAAVDRLVAAADRDHDGGVSLDEARNSRLAKLHKNATPETAN